MKYACLIYYDERKWAKLPATEMDEAMAEYFEFTEQAGESGHLMASEALHPTSTATTVRVRGGRTDTTDGPFAETREQLGGFYLIEARDLNEAMQVAARIPAARWGSVEVRPVVESSTEQEAGR